MNFPFICDKLLLDDDVDPKSDNFSLNVDSKCWNYVYFKLICCCCCINTSTKFTAIKKILHKYYGGDLFNSK